MNANQDIYFHEEQMWVFLGSDVFALLLSLGVRFFSDRVDLLFYGGSLTLVLLVFFTIQGMRHAFLILFSEKPKNGIIGLIFFTIIFIPLLISLTVSLAQFVLV